MLENKIEHERIYEDEDTFVILDHRPLTKGHCLVITKKQIDHLDDCDPELYRAVFDTVHKISRLLKKALKPLRVVLVVHGFEIPHAHVHVVPVYTGQELHLASKDREEPGPNELKSLREQLALKESV